MLHASKSSNFMAPKDGLFKQSTALVLTVNYSSHTETQTTINLALVVNQVLLISQPARSDDQNR